jgi:hypothetical protein
MFSKTLSSAALALLAATTVAGAAEPTVAQPTNGNAFPGAKDNFDPVYNVCRGTDPS